MSWEKVKDRQRSECWNEVLQHLVPQCANEEKCENTNQSITAVASNTEQKETNIQCMNVSHAEVGVLQGDTSCGH